MKLKTVLGHICLIPLYTVIGFFGIIVCLIIYENPIGLLLFILAVAGIGVTCLGFSLLTPPSEDKKDQK